METFVENLDSNKKKFVVINGSIVYIIKRESMEDAVIFAQNYMDHSEEVIVREFKSIENYVKD